MSGRWRSHRAATSAAKRGSKTMRNEQTMASQRRAKKEGCADMGAELTTRRARVNPDCRRRPPPLVSGRLLEGRPMRFRAVSLALAAALAAAVACKTTAGGDRPTPSLKSARIEIDQTALVGTLVQKHGEASRPRAERGVRQVAAFWRKEDGDAATLRAFTEVAFVADPQQLDALLRRFSAALEQIDGHMVEIGRALRSWSELELGSQMDVDQLFAALDVAAHVPEDLFSTKLAFVALLNFPQPDLQEMVAEGPRWSRKQWAQARLTRRFVVRPSGAAMQAVARARADGDAYISGYNIWMHHVLAPDGRRLFPKGVRLLTHWNLRDQIKADYAEPDRPLALASKAGARGDG